MTIRTLIVDDSSFFRRRLKEVLEKDGDIRVAGEADDGARAVEMAGRLRPDVVTMDVSMPVMDGIAAVRQIMSQTPMPILMVSALTRDGAKSTLEALEAGAVDFVTKSYGDLADDQGGMRLREQIRALAGRRSRPKSIEPRLSPAPRVRRGQYQLLHIGSSTGGPIALQKILTRLPAAFPLPVLVIQHMPADFTGPFAERLDGLCALKVKEATDKSSLAPGTVLIAPGGRQCLPELNGGGLRVRIQEAKAEERYRPCVDLSFSAAARALPGKVLALVLTGMGSDGKVGAAELKKTGATVWSQDEASCVVYGMPMAVAKAGLSDRVLPLDGIADALIGTV